MQTAVVDGFAERVDVARVSPGSPPTRVHRAWRPSGVWPASEVGDGSGSTDSAASRKNQISEFGDVSSNTCKRLACQPHG